MPHYKYDYVVHIGRFQPLHNGHCENISQCLKIGEKVIIMVGSAFLPRDPKNPFTYPERKEMIERVFEPFMDRIIILPLRDMIYDNTAWLEQVHNNFKLATGNDTDSSVALYGFDKDESSEYINWFPKWDKVVAKPHTGGGSTVIDATKIRDLYFRGKEAFIQSVVDPVTYEWLQSMIGSPMYDYIKNEMSFYDAHSAMWANTPYKVTFNTADAVVICFGHILLVRRRSAPGKGLWALPGGYLEYDETHKHTAIRELIEETKIKLPKPRLESSITYEKLFDHPQRSLRGRINTMAYLFEIQPDSPSLPKVKTSNETDKVKWFSLSEIESMSETMFEDHLSIIEHMKTKITRNPTLLKGGKV